MKFDIEKITVKEAPLSVSRFDPPEKIQENFAENYVTKVCLSARETVDDFIINTCLPYAQTVESRIDKESLKKAIRMYYGKDVQEVRHGKMNMYKPRSMNRNATYKCSVCGKLCSSYYNDVGEWKFCPHCGAKVEGAEK